MYRVGEVTLDDEYVNREEIFFLLIKINIEIQEIVAVAIPITIHIKESVELGPVETSVCIIAPGMSDME